MDLDEALAVAAPLLEPWWHVREWPDSPPWTGGVYDWPARDTDVCALARSEEHLIWDFIAWKEEKSRARPAPEADR